MAHDNRLVAIVSILAILIFGAVGYGCVTSRSATSGAASPPSSSPAQGQLGQDTQASSEAIKQSDRASSQSSAPILSQNVSNGSGSSTSALNLSDPATSAALTNMVRPEIRHILQSKYSDPSEQQTALIGAGLLQYYLNQSSSAQKQMAVRLMKQYDCQMIRLTQADQTLIKSLTFDTPERMAAIKTGLKDYQPPVSSEIVIDNSGNAISPCTF
ncbi:MAG: hypothetical protein Q4P13_02475 [Psychrobacter sp.]|nr:hypothetical protein [Psychrobacter sp.]